MKNSIDTYLAAYMYRNGYTRLESSRLHYALSSFTFSYFNNSGNKDNIKIEINYMDRCHILPLEYKQIMLNDVVEQFDILILNPIELYSSKINALLSRATPRDLYDVNAMIEKNIISDTLQLKKCLIFYNMIGGKQNLDLMPFEKIQNISYMKVKTQLKPVISKLDSFNLDKAKNTVILYLKKLISLTDQEIEFIKQFKNNNFIPELLFDDQKIINNIKEHPMALWRCKNNM